MCYGNYFNSLKQEIVREVNIQTEIQGVAVTETAMCVEIAIEFR